MILVEQVLIFVTVTLFFFFFFFLGGRGGERCRTDFVKFSGGTGQTVQEPAGTLPKLIKVNPFPAELGYLYNSRQQQQNKTNKKGSQIEPT